MGAHTTHPPTHPPTHTHTHTHTHTEPVLMSKLGCLWPTIVHWHWGIAGLSEGPWWIPTGLRPPVKVWEEERGSKMLNGGGRRWQKIAEYRIQGTGGGKPIVTSIQMHRCVYGCYMDAPLLTCMSCNMSVIPKNGTKQYNFMWSQQTHSEEWPAALL